MTYDLFILPVLPRWAIEFAAFGKAMKYLLGLEMTGKIRESHVSDALLIFGRLTNSVYLFPAPVFWWMSIA